MSRLQTNRIESPQPLTVARRVGAFCTIDEIHRAREQVARALQDDVLFNGLAWTMRNQHGKFTACLALNKIAIADQQGTVKRIRIYEQADHSALPPRVLHKLLSVDRWRRAILWHDRKRT